MRTIRSWMRRCLVLASVLLAGLPALSHAADVGAYNILQARYGTASHNVDVTDRLRELARSDTTVQVSNSLLGGDPDPGQTKALRIYAKGPDGRTHTFEYPEGGMLYGALFTGWSDGNWRGGAWRGGWGDSAVRPPAPGGDEGEYQILQARYGTASRNIDVTDRLKDLARQDRSFVMGNDTWGTDPAPGEVKTLRIFARARNGSTRTFEYPENTTVDGSRFTGWSSGSWGQGGWSGWGGWGGDGTDSAQAGGDEGEYQILQARYGTASRNIDVTPRLKDLARQDRLFRMGNDTWGTDPAPGEVKTLRIFARARSGGVRTFEYREGSTVNGTLFTGWSSGRWGQGGWSGDWGGGDYVQAGDDQLIILSASYGAGSRRTLVTSRLQSLVRNGRLETRVDNDLAGEDPAPNEEKTLTVVYDFGGRTSRVTVRERDLLRVP